MSKDKLFHSFGQWMAGMPGGCFVRSQMHSLLPLVTYALKKTGYFKGTEFEPQIQRMLLQDVYTYEIKSNDLKKICALFNDEGIEYIPLKGSRIKELYREEWLRTSSDIDVLIHREDIDKAENLLIEKLGFRKEIDNYHDVSFFAPSGVSLELHFSIKENTANLDRVLEKVWENSYQCGDETEWRQTDEFFVFHIIAHAAYHFMGGGCGIRTFVDLYVINHEFEYDHEIVRAWCQEAGIEKFYDTMLALIDYWFEGGDGADVPDGMEEYIISGGTHGSANNKIAAKQKANGGKSGYVMKRIFADYDHLCGIYPELEGHKAKMPIYQVKRWIDRTVHRGGFSDYREELKANNRVSEEQVYEVGKLMEELELM